MRVIWSPSPNFNARDRRFPLKGDVSHRIVGSAPTALRIFGATGSTPTRKASSHFVIGHDGQGERCPQCSTGARGLLRVWQTVDLANMAWTNGDVREPTWKNWQPGVNPNLTTVTTEHEDMASAGHHVITEHVWRASMELKKLLRSGDLAAIRAAGIRVSNGAFSAHELVAQMAAWPISEETYIDHHAIAGPNKPWCWRDYDHDKGLPSRLPGLFAYLKGEEDMLRQDMKELDVSVTGHIAWIKAGATARTRPIFDPSDYDANKAAAPHGSNVQRVALGWVPGTPIILAGGGVFAPEKRWLATNSVLNSVVFYHERDIVSLTPPTGVNRAEYEELVDDLAEVSADYTELLAGLKDLVAGK